MHGVEGWILVSWVYSIGHLEGRNLYITLLYVLTLPLSFSPHSTSCILLLIQGSTCHSHRPRALPGSVHRCPVTDATQKSSSKRSQSLGSSQPCPRRGAIARVSTQTTVPQSKRLDKRHTSGVHLSHRKHMKYRTQRCRAAWNLIRGLARLPPASKRAIAIGQLLRILPYGCELHTTPSPEVEPTPSPEVEPLAAQIDLWV